MEKIKRSERLIAMTRMLSAEPGRLFTLRDFANRFGCAKSTLSEDIAVIRETLIQYGLGEVESVSGAAGGARFLPFSPEEEDRRFLQDVQEQLMEPGRTLPGGFLYTVDLFSDPWLLGRMGETFARRFYQTRPDAVMTVDAMGVPIALCTARALGKPLITARLGHRVSEGPVVSLNYMSTSSQQLQTMSLPRRSLAAGHRVLIIDDFMRGGGTAKAMCDMCREFGCEVAGLGVVITTREPEHKRVPEYMALFCIDDVPSEYSAARVRCMI